MSFRILPLFFSFYLELTIKLVNKEHKGNQRSYATNIKTKNNLGRPNYFA